MNYKYYSLHGLKKYLEFLDYRLGLEIDNPELR